MVTEDDQIVSDLRDAIRDGRSGLRYVPKLLRLVLERGAWRERVDEHGERHVFATFDEFAAAAPMAGLGSDVDLVRRIVADDTTTRDLLDQAVQNPVGHPTKGSNRTSSKVGGTTRDAALRRLRKDAPDLHALVLAGDLSPHAAMIKAGFRRRTITVPADSTEAIARTLRRQLAPAEVADLARLLTEG